MKTIIIAMFFSIAVTISLASPLPLPEDINTNFDETRLRASRIVVCDFQSTSLNTNNTVYFELDNKADIQQFFDNVKFTNSRTSDHCDCTPYPIIIIRHSDKKNGIGILQLKHDLGIETYGGLWFFTPETRVWLNTWLKGNGFPVEDMKCRAHNNQKKTSNQKLQPTVKTPDKSGNVQGTAAEL